MKIITKTEALKKHLNLASDEIEDKEDGRFEIGKEEWQVYTDEEADKATQDYIKESVWAFNASSILGECGLPFSGEESLKSMQEKSCENANDFILALVEKTCGLEQFVSDAISADGRGHFLSGYDSEEVELDGGYYAYRTN